MKAYTLKLVEGTDDQYKVYTDNRGSMLCDDQVFSQFVRVEDLWALIESCEGDIDYLKFKLPKREP